MWSEVRLQELEDLAALAARQQVDLVDGQRRPSARALDGHEIAVDEPRVQRRRLRRDHDHDDVDVGGDCAPPLRARAGRRA